MLTVHQLSKSFILTTLFENATFSVNAGERVALIGPNGSGKTTLMRIIARAEMASSGTVTHANTLRIGYLPQGFELPLEESVSDIIEAAIGSIDALESELMRLAEQLAVTPEDAELQDRYDAVLARLVSADYGKSAEILTSLSLDTIDQTLPAKYLSGGQKTRLSLALILLNDPQLLLLDEPTNHLDIAMLRWLETWLANFSGAVLLISHDRTFLDQTATSIVAIDPDTKRAREYSGNYTSYLEQWNNERDKQDAAYRDQVYEERRLRQAANSDRARADTIHRTTKPNNPYLRKQAKRAMARAKSKEKRLERYLDSDERVDKVKQNWQLDIDFTQTQQLGKSVLTIEGLVVGYANYPPLLRIRQLFLRSGQRVVLTGANGSGKTTLLKTIAARLPTLSGTAKVGHSVKLGYMSQEQENVDLNKSPTQLLLDSGLENETDARNYLHHYLFNGDEAVKPAGQLSFGQRARLELALLVAQGCNVLLLDEPINHLDIASRELFEQALVQFSGTTLAVVHDRYFIERFASEVWWVENGGIRVEIR